MGDIASNHGHAAHEAGIHPATSPARRSQNFQQFRNGRPILRPSVPDHEPARHVKEIRNPTRGVSKNSAFGAGLFSKYGI
jgi:hypothetical protein